MAQTHALTDGEYRDFLQLLAAARNGFPNLQSPHRRRSRGGGGGGTGLNVAKLFEVESPATGPGIYNCLPTVIDSSQWDVAQQFDIIDVVQVGTPPDTSPVTETEQVLNLDELVNISDTWALGKSYAAGDWTNHVGTDRDYRCITAHCSGGCNQWIPATWTIGDRCKYTTTETHAYKLGGSDKTSGDTTPPDLDSDWVLDDDEPGVGNAWEFYWDEGPDPKLSAGAMIIAWKVTDDEGNVRWVGKQFGQDFIDQFINAC